MKKETEELLRELERLCTYEEGEVKENEHGIKYRIDKYTCKYTMTPYWLTQLYERAAFANRHWKLGMFSDGGCDFYRERKKYGRIHYTKLVELK